MWYQNIRSALFGFVTKHVYDRRTDRITTPNTALAYARAVTRVIVPFRVHVWYQNIRSALFGFVTKRACDRQTDRIATPKTALA